MVKRGYKLQEFVAHSTKVNCLCIGKKAGRLFITGGDDSKINLWAVGSPFSLMSLCGRASPVKSLAFHTSEALVLSGASTGTIKLWDLEEAKTVRTFTGHGATCTAVQFHPFGEFFASGSMDTNLKIWDPRKKGCLRTYEGHTRGISTIRFSPDGRWVLSGGYDNVVKVWDLTAGKLLHDFMLHDGHIRSLEFHPLEFLLATGSADRTVKFWDLETFELVGSARAEAMGVRNIAFHPDGSTLFCGFDDSLKVYSWEPVICHDTVDMGWSTLGDLCINDGKLLGCSYYQISVGVWVANTSLVEPYRVVPEESCCNEHKLSVPKTQSTSGLHSRSSDDDSTDFKDIHVDSTGPNLVAAQRLGSAKETVTSSRTKPGMLHRPAPESIRMPLNSKANVDKPSACHDIIRVKYVPNKFEEVLSPERPYNQETCDGFINSSKERPSVKVGNGVAVIAGRTQSLVERFERQEGLGDSNDATLKEDNSGDITEELIQAHDVFLNSLQSRLTKLQVVSHSWKQNDIEGAIGAMRKLPDHSVQADVISVLVEKSEVLTLGLFSCLLPVLVGLLDSNIERHAKVSLDMLLKLVAIFGPVVNATISAPPKLGVDLHVDERRECCNQCHLQLQKIQQILPELIRKGGVLAKFAQDLSLVLQEP